MPVQAIEILGDDGDVPLLNALIGSRSAFRECQAIGCTVHGVPGAHEAVQEVGDDGRQSCPDRVIPMATKLKSLKAGMLAGMAAEKTRNDTMDRFARAEAAISQHRTGCSQSQRPERPVVS